MRHNRSMISPPRSSRPPLLASALVLSLAFSFSWGAARAQEEVKVKSLAAPDYFSGAVADTGISGDLWKDTAPGIMRDVLPKLAGPKPLSPAFASLARRALSTGANGPAGVGDDVEMGAARGLALIALGEAKGADAILDRATGGAGSAALSMAQAEAALITGNDDKACQTEQGLTVDRGTAYWLRLRAFCQLKAGQTDAAQLTFQLAQPQTPKPVGADADYARLMSAALAGTPPGAANLKTGLNYAR
jgi:ABC-type amino acid transport substrate-binding protein